jgi:FkbM family methyltransferase
MIKLRFSEIRSNNILGKSLRFPLSVLPKTTVLSIMQGPGKGMKWIVGSGVHGMWLGSYEADKQQILADIPLEGTTVLDIGANVGFFSILLSRLVGPKGKVIAFEPLPRNIDFINQHIQLNKLENITVYAAAVGEKTGVMRFDSSPCHSQGRLALTGDLEVPVITLDSLSKLDNPVSFVKIDVEGAEADVLRGSESFFKSNRPIILLATHGRKEADDCQKILSDYGYSLTIINRDLYGSGCDEWLVKPNS